MIKVDQVLVRKFSEILPDRKRGKRGPEPIAKEALVEGLFLRLMTGIAWNKIRHSASIRRYFQELQRRGFLFQFIKEETKQKKRPKKSLIDSTNIDTQRGSKMSKYSGKYHNYCVKFTIIISGKGELIDFSLNKGSESDSKIFDEMLSRIEKLPYEILADKGYEKYERRRDLKKKNCQLRIEMKRKIKNKKRGRRFLFTKEHKAQRSQVERFFAYLKTFKIFRLFRFRKISALKMALYVAIILIFIIS